MPTPLHPSVLDKIFIIDFEDSFTHNIASVLFPFENRVSIINVHEFFDQQFENFLKHKKRRAIILGPGPGHPEIYQNYFEKIKILRNIETVYIMGICLGHQILGLIDGKKVLKAHCPVHGQTVTINFKDTSQRVQRYNSLVISDDGIVKDIRYFARGVSYQFHPESIGTQNNAIFFEELLDFIQKD